MPAISVICPVYKAEKYIHRCVDSILAQTFTDFELLLIDDGSPDRSGKICDEYVQKDNRIRVIHQENKGVSASRNTGLEVAKGDYIIHVDSDDWVETKMLDEMYNTIKSSNSDLLIVDYICNYNKRDIYKIQAPHRNDAISILHDILEGKLHGSCWNKLIKKGIIDKYNMRFPLNINFGEDTIFWAELLQKNITVSYLNRAYYHYNILSNSSLTDVDSIEKIKNRMSFVDLLSKTIDNNEFRDELLKRKSMIKLAAFNSGFFNNSYVYNLYEECNSETHVTKNLGINGLSIRLICQKHFGVAKLIGKTYMALKKIYNKL